MRALYFDCFAGASGDMLIGALLDLGLDLEELKRHLSTLNLSGYRLTAEKVKRSGIAATKFNVELDGASQPLRHLKDVAAIIYGSALSGPVKRSSIAAFERLAVAEARVHGTTIDLVHFHEVGAVDSILDTVGAFAGFELLGIERFFASPLRVGKGTVDVEHGSMPVPAPGTAELLRGVPIYAGDLDGEFVTPTGAAILTSVCESFAPLPFMRVVGVGYGAGSRDPKGFPNALRVILGEVAAGEQPDETVMVVETNIDDMSPQVYGFVMEKAFAIGALDFFITPVQMKKDRPGSLLTVLCRKELLHPITELLLAETSTLGVRYYEAKRRILDRQFVSVDTQYGAVRIKVARDGGRTLHFQPEYEDCARLAAEAGASLIEVQSAAIAAYRSAASGGNVAADGKNQADG